MFFNTNDPLLVWRCVLFCASQHYEKHKSLRCDLVNVVVYRVRHEYFAILSLYTLLAVCLYSLSYARRRTLVCWVSKQYDAGR